MVSMANICASIPDITVAGIGSSLQCPQCGHVWKVSSDNSYKFWEDDTSSYVTDEEYAIMWQDRGLWSDLIRRYAFFGGIGFMIMGFIFRVIGKPELATLITVTSAIVLVGGIIYSFYMSKALGWKNRKKKPLSGFSEPRTWPCYRQDISTADQASISLDFPS